MFDEILFAVGRTDQKDQILKIAANLVIQSQHNLCLTSSLETWISYALGLVYVSTPNHMQGENFRI